MVRGIIMTEYFVLITFLCILLANVESVHAIKCYSCASAIQTDCSSSNSEVLEKYKMDCSIVSSIYAKSHSGQELTRCAKTQQDGKINRSCYNSDPNFDDTCKDGNASTACLCRTDFCNGGQVGIM